ncbi:hypothetical protein ABH930_004894 [Kitasatospora sp. GAS204A]|uniref:hypothetical protein n=1 Tax=unclassified Kitasatospora TaxID=2633591 RepID=UPI0024754051|nr:hypothetical protein [Kitasatospora sp. GAS204B]MDH6120798.1 hypothetical protein [Kitasatospora sp. GAS204B]
MSSSFIPMDTPNQRPAGETTAELPQVCPPRAGEPANAADPVPRDPGAATTANLRAGLASRLRTAYEQGAELLDLATASHQSVAEVEQLLALAGADPTAERPARSTTIGPAGDVPAPRDGLVEALTDGEPAAEFGDRTSPDSGEGATGIDDTWRPSPARPRPRIRRPAPARRTVLRPGAPDTVESRAASPEAVAAAGPAAAVGSAAVDSGTVGNETAGSEAVGVSTAPEPPLGILIGGRRAVPGSVGRAAEQRFRRVTAQLIRVGRGTTLAVLPSWRPSIAISVPTELLLAATGLSYEELGRAELTVLINFDALHDRELRPREWQVTPDHGGGRRRRG